HTQVPNKLFDELIPTLKEGELRVILVVMRQTYGWHKIWDRISITFLMKKTGMCRQSVCLAVRNLIKKGMINKKKSGGCGTEQVFYSLCLIDDEKTDEKEPNIETKSNKLYQSTKETPPSLLSRPSKETLTKEKKKEKIYKKENPPAPKGERTDLAKLDSSISFCKEEGKLHITEKELEKWQSNYEGIDLKLEILEMERWLIANPSKANKKNWGKFMRNWLKKHEKEKPKEDTKTKQFMDWVYGQYQKYLNYTNDTVYLDKAIKIEGDLIKLASKDVVLGKATLPKLCSCLFNGLVPEHLRKFIQDQININKIDCKLSEFA
ncbi:MAG: replication protein, partial [Bacteroidetes bacterium]|nr:replication protein [Bacteroidota bacterium]